MSTGWAGSRCAFARLCVALTFKWITFLRALSLNQNFDCSFDVLSDVYLCLFQLNAMVFGCCFSNGHLHWFGFSFLLTFRISSFLWDEMRSSMQIFVFIFKEKIFFQNTIRWPSYKRFIMDRITCGEMDRQWTV